MTTITITSGDNSTGPFGVGTGEGWATSDNIDFPAITNPVGSVSPSSPVVGSYPAGMVATFIQNLGVGTINVFLQGRGIANGFPFTSMSFTDKNSVLETYTAASATFDVLTYLGYAWWHWPAQLNSPFANGVAYPVTFTGGPSFPAPTGLVAMNPSGFTVDLSWAPSLQSTASLLLHCDGTNGSTNFPDSSPNNFTMTASGSAQVSTANPLFGTGDAQLGNGVAGGISTPVVANGPLDFGAGDFTVEMWLLIPSAFGLGPNLFPSYLAGGAPSNWLFVSDGTSGGSGSGFGPWPNFQIQATINSTLTILSPSVTLLANTWHHCALVRFGTALTVYLDGAGGSAVTIGGATAVNAPATLNIGGTEFQPSNVDEVRITKGLAVYTANFTPPNAPFSGGVPPPGYDIYRGGVSIGTYVGAYSSYIDTVPGPGIYTYTVAAYDGVSTDISLQSAPANVTIPVGGPGSPSGGGGIAWIGNTGYLTSKFVSPGLGKAIMLANPGVINPRAYLPQEDTDARVQLPRLPL